MKKVTVIATLFVFSLCSTCFFCYASNSQVSGNSLKGTMIADKKDREEKIEKLEEKIKQLKEDKDKIEKEIKEIEKELRHQRHHHKKS